MIRLFVDQAIALLVSDTKKKQQQKNKKKKEKKRKRKNKLHLVNLSSFRYLYYICFTIFIYISIECHLEKHLQIKKFSYIFLEVKTFYQILSKECF